MESYRYLNLSENMSVRLGQNHILFKSMVYGEERTYGATVSVTIKEIVNNSDGTIGGMKDYIGRVLYNYSGSIHYKEDISIEDLAILKNTLQRSILDYGDEIITAAVEEGILRIRKQQLGEVNKFQALDER